ncbi:oligopeptide transport ATP-binding protein AppF [Treponema primitia ZAS-2]|uniref:Oligopeptide transport ATP-binding protein AppF n=1 Tax=Treponema primitia (strain ATCC BAA-887 / DSM 12427 / ZAS-2) TaxID=545694 RepID=F5YQG0_TREPZ|nr:oligopeptide/dipeptide ABC transporter ATP-binding protein [Treponema primitia]AEF83916.1 oligopeptide transport ATP-binding protein AppF [Treponema primitia ZAS-2]
MTRLIELENLKKRFRVKEAWGKVRYIHAVENVPLYIEQGETLGLVGESGCGKTTLGRTILRLHEPSSGKIFFRGQDITHADMLPYRRKMQIIFQDPSSSLNPRMTVGEIVGEPIDIHHLASSRPERKDRINYLLSRVGLNSEHANRYPHEFSGGQQQRIGIARALAVEPEFIVCDEPVSALDVSIQSQIVNMLEDMQRELGLTYLFIAHDISVVRHISRRIGVMYLGNLVELAASKELYKNPLHPYTKTLLQAVPIPDPRITRSRQRTILNGEIPSPMDLPPGCRFSTLCPNAMQCCSETAPMLKEIAPGHQVACHLFT